MSTTDELLTAADFLEENGFSACEELRELVQWRKDAGSISLNLANFPDQYQTVSVVPMRAISNMDDQRVSEHALMDGMRTACYQLNTGKPILLIPHAEQDARTGDVAVTINGYGTKAEPGDARRFVARATARNDGQSTRVPRKFG